MLNFNYHLNGQIYCIIELIICVYWFDWHSSIYRIFYYLVSESKIDSNQDIFRCLDMRTMDNQKCELGLSWSTNKSLILFYWLNKRFVAQLLKNDFLRGILKPHWESLLASRKISGFSIRSQLDEKSKDCRYSRVKLQFYWYPSRTVRLYL